MKWINIQIQSFITVFSSTPQSSDLLNLSMYVTIGYN